MRSTALACRSCLVVLALVLFAPPAGAGTRLPRTLELASGWRFQQDPLVVGEVQGWQQLGFDHSIWRAVPVPASWDSYDPIMDGYEGVCWYARRIDTDEIVPDAWQRLRFGRVNHRVRVWLDGTLVAEDSLGYVPFEVTATPHLVPGRPAWLVLRVENGTRYDWLPGTPIVEWVQYGGLLEPVEWLTTAPAYIARLAIDARPQGPDGRVRASVEVTNAGGHAFEGHVRIAVAGRFAKAPVRVARGATGTTPLELVIPKARRWSPADPALYTLEARLLRGGREVDAITDRFGVRSIEAHGRQLLLNGRPLRIRGVNRYDEFPGCGPVADAAAVRADLEAIRAAGANFVRVHYPQRPSTLRLADELGLLFMEEVPLNWWRAEWHPSVPPQYRNDRIVDSAEQVLERLVRRDANHPSVVIWSMANECRTDDSLGVHAMERLLRRAHAFDSTRLVTYVANRSFAKNAAFKDADLVAANLYFGMWEGRTADSLADLEALVRQPTRAALGELSALFPGKPLLLSEFGTIGIPGSRGDLRFSEDYQAAYLAAVWRALSESPDFCGGAVWSWADYRHRRGFLNDYPAFFGPFGMVTLDRRPKQALATLGALWRREVAAEGVR